MKAQSYTVGSTGGNKEWLDGALTILEPESTPFTSMLAKSNDAKGVFHEVMSDRLRAPRITGTREGDSGAKGGDKTTKRARFGAYLHRWMDTFGVSDVQQAISQKGGNAATADEYGDSKTKCVREVKRDIEATLLSNQETQGGTDDAMQLRGYFKWIVAGSAASPTFPEDFQPPTAQRVTGVATLLESSVNAVLKSLHDQTGESQEYNLLAGSDYIEDIDLFSVANTADGATKTAYTTGVTVADGSVKKISMIVKIFESSFGRVVIQPSKFINISTTTAAHNATCCAIYRRDLWKMSFLEALHGVDDWDDAGGEGGYVKAIGGLFCKQPRGNAYICNALNT